MPVLSFSCVSRLQQSSQIVRRRTWIKGHDLRTLALAATEQLKAPSDQCTYTLIPPSAQHRHVLLEVDHEGDDALVGPMAGPIPPVGFAPDPSHKLDDLLACLGFEGVADESSQRHDEDGPRRYLVTVAYRSLRESSTYPPPREARESDDRYRRRCQEAERIRIDRTRHQGFHVVSYDVPPREWTAYDLEMMMGLAYQFLPTSEPRWREAGAVTQARFATAGGQTRRVTVNYCLEVARGEYVACVRLPAFPTLALAEWLADRRCDISLRHPVMKLELVARGWRCRTPVNTAAAVDAAVATVATGR